jgi:hypothetical protein
MNRASQQVKKELHEMAQGEGYVKIFVSTMLGAALGISVTFMTGVSSNATEIVRLTTRIEGLSETINNTMTDRYKGADAKRDFALIQEQIRNIMRQSRELEVEFKEHVAAHNAEHNR